MTDTLRQDILDKLVNDCKEHRGYGCSSCEPKDSEGCWGYLADEISKLPGIASERIKSHYEGMKNGIRLYAWWQDGVQYVGTTGRTLKQAFEEIDSMEKEALTAAGVEKC